jgi:hypothetical protein
VQRRRRAAKETDAADQAPKGAAPMTMAFMMAPPSKIDWMKDGPCGAGRLSGRVEFALDHRPKMPAVT